MKKKIIYFVIFAVVIIAAGTGFLLFKKSPKVEKCQNFTGGSFKLVFNTNGGDEIEKMSICIACAPDSYQEIPDGVKKDFIFAGWYYDEKLTKEVETTSTLDIKPIPKKDKNGCVTGYEEITLYAKWVDKEIEVENVTLDKKEIKLNVGETATIKATITPKDATNKKLTWSTSNSRIATVSNGKITAKGEGTTTITVKTSNDKKATVSVIVKKAENREKAVTAVTLDKTSLTLTKGDTYQLNAKIEPTDATNKTLTWTSSNETIATVNNGKVTTKGIGTVVITVKSNNDKKATSTITVKEKEEAKKLATDLNLSESTITLDYYGTKSAKVIATTTPSITTNSVTWTTSNSKIATVSNDGTITAVNGGECTVKAAIDGIEKTVKVRVKKGVFRFYVNDYTTGKQYMIFNSSGKVVNKNYRFSYSNYSYSYISKAWKLGVETFEEKDITFDNSQAPNFVWSNGEITYNITKGLYCQKLSFAYKGIKADTLEVCPELQLALSKTGNIVAAKSCIDPTKCSEMYIVPLKGETSYSLTLNINTFTVKATDGVVVNKNGYRAEFSSPKDGAYITITTPGGQSLKYKIKIEN